REPDRRLRCRRAGRPPTRSPRPGRPVMNILVTGSSGWLGQTLVPRLRRDGHTVVGLDPDSGATTDVVGSVVDRALVRKTIRERGVTAIVHAAARHKPHIETHDNSEFV